MRRAVGAVLGWALTVAVVVAVVAVGVLFYLTRAQGWALQTVATGSTEPTLPTGSVLLSRPVQPWQVKVGDVITFDSPVGRAVGTGAGAAVVTDSTTLVTHRVTVVKNTAKGYVFRTKGDANRAADPWTVPGSSVRAGLVASVPAVGGWLETGSLRRALFLLLALVGLLVVLLESRTAVLEVRKGRAARAAAAAGATDGAVAVPAPDGQSVGAGPGPVPDPVLEPVVAAAVARATGAAVDLTGPAGAPVLDLTARLPRAPRQASAADDVPAPDPVPGQTAPADAGELVPDR